MRSACWPIWARWAMREARSAFEGLIDLTGGRPQGARTREEIVDRLMEQAADAAALRLDPKIAETGGKAARRLRSRPKPRSRKSARSPNRPASRSRRRSPPWRRALPRSKKLGVDPGRVSFAARFGRNMEYYTGFVFELWSKDAEGPVQVAGGGRYDTLLENLGAERPIPAIGFSIRTERVLAARAAQREGAYMSARLTLAVPSKGRLQDQVQAYFADAGIADEEGRRRARLSRHARRALPMSMSCCCRPRRSPPPCSRATCISASRART